VKGGLDPRLSLNPYFHSRTDPQGSNARYTSTWAIGAPERLSLGRATGVRHPCGARQEQDYSLRASSPKSRCTASYQASSLKAFQSTHCSSVIAALHPTNGAAFGPGK
jgi:hypothetical protein